MSQSVTNAQQSLVSSDYKIDKVIYKKSFSGTVPQGLSMSDAVVFSFAHGLPFKPLCIGTYSEDNFATSYEFGNFPYFYFGVASQYGPRIMATVESDDTYVSVHAVNFDTTRNFQFRIVGLLPSNFPANTEIASPPRASGLLFNSDDNYLKIYQQGTFEINDDGSFGLVDYPVSHNLGYIPTTLLFSEWGGTVRQFGSENFIGVSGIDAFAWITTSQVIMSVDPYFAGFLRLHYKVYLDA